jgi:hypothetical protein
MGQGGKIKKKKSLPDQISASACPAGEIQKK